MILWKPHNNIVHDIVNYVIEVNKLHEEVCHFLFGCLATD